MRENLLPLVNAVLYSDIFGYALTREELFRYAVGKCSVKDLHAFMKDPPNFICCEDGFICLKINSQNINLRKNRRQINNKKLEIAKKIARILSFIPSIRFIGLSGSVAMQNADSSDDIDFFIITESHSIWKTRLLTTLIVKLLGKKREKNHTDFDNKICLNMFMSNDNLKLSNDRQDLYTAHEVVQLIPLIDKNNTYKYFLSENKWIHNFLPNAMEIISFKRSFLKYKKLTLFESFAKAMQLRYMEKNRTIEKVNDKILAFHPIDYRTRTLKEYNDRKEKYASV